MEDSSSDRNPLEVQRNATNASWSLDQRITRRQAISTAAKVGIGVAAAAVAAGVGVYAYESSASSSSGPVSFQWDTSYDPSQPACKWMEDWITDFNSTYSGKYQVVADYQAECSVLSTFIAETQAKKAPATLMLAVECILEFEAADSLLPLNDKIATLTSCEVNDFQYWPYNKEYETGSDGNVYSLPFQGFPYTIPYRTDLLDPLSIDPNGADKPSNVQQFATLVEEIYTESKNTLNLLIPLDQDPVCAFISELPFCKAMMSTTPTAGIQPFASGIDGAATLTSEPVIQGFTLLNDLVQMGVIPQNNVTEPTRSTIKSWWGEPQYAMWAFQGGWALTSAYNSYNIPYSSMSQLIAPFQVYSDTWDVSLSANLTSSKDIDAAWQWAHDIIWNPNVVLQGYEDPSLGIGQIPTTQSLFNDLVSFYGSMYNTIMGPGLQAQAQGMTYLSQHVHLNDLCTAVSAAAQQIFLGTASVQDALSSAETSFNNEYYPGGSSSSSTSA